VQTVHTLHTTHRVLHLRVRPRKYNVSKVLSHSDRPDNDDDYDDKAASFDIGID